MPQSSLHTGRMSFLSTIVFFHSTIAGRVSAALISAFLQFPAFFSCTRTPAHSVRTTSGNNYIDVFFFDTISPQHLDSYQRLRRDDTLYALSSDGVKRVVALDVHSRGTEAWSGIRTYADLCKYSFSLKADSPENPLRAGEAVLDDGLSRVADLPMKSSLARVVLGSVACDFSDTPYTGLGFNNKLIYIQYAGVEARPFGPEAGIPVSTVNQGWLDSAAVMSFPRAEMLLQEGLGNIWRQRIIAEREFWCYANDVDTASLGRPVTRIVLDGFVGNHRCFYPVELTGLKAEKTYYLDITLRRMGTPDPDIPARGDMVSVEAMVAPWRIMDKREEIFE